MNLWIVTANFGDTTATKLLIESLSKVNDSKSIKIAIADNASSAKSIFDLKQLAKKTKLDVEIFPFKKKF